MLRTAVEEDGAEPTMMLRQVALPEVLRARSTRASFQQGVSLALPERRYHHDGEIEPLR
jgi:hypothetical protein